MHEPLANMLLRWAAASKRWRKAYDVRWQSSSDRRVQGNAPGGYSLGRLGGFGGRLCLQKVAQTVRGWHAPSCPIGLCGCLLDNACSLAVFVQALSYRRSKNPGPPILHPASFPHLVFTVHTRNPSTHSNEATDRAERARSVCVSPWQAPTCAAATAQPAEWNWPKPVNLQLAAPSRALVMAGEVAGASAVASRVPNERSM